MKTGLWLACTLAMMLLTGCDNSTGTKPSPGANADATGNTDNTSNGTTPDPAPVTDTPPPVETWVAHNSPAGRFSIQFPATPKVSKMDLPTDAGNLEMHLVGAGNADSYFAVMYNDFPEAVVADGDAEGMLDGGRDNLVAQHNGTLLKEEKITIDGHPGREVSIEAVAQGVEASIHSRMYVVKPRLYQVMIVGKKGTLSEADVTKFFDSFKLKAE